MPIRDFADRDVAPACRLTNHFIEHTVVHFGMKPATDAEFAAVWHARAPYPWLAAEVEGVFAGYAKASRWRERDAYARTAEVGLYVEPAFHKQGLGRALYTEVLNRLRTAGFHTAIGGVTLPNHASVRLHESMGFTKVGVFRQVGRKFDQWHDVGFWQIQL
jgi:phosphinothricin acetyltransferase